MTPDDIWTANKYLKEPIGNGGNPRIPTLRIKDEQGTETKVNDNRDKANLFAASFFPPPPVNTNVPANFTYPQPIPNPPQITKAQIEKSSPKTLPVQGLLVLESPVRSGYLPFSALTVTETG